MALIPEYEYDIFISYAHVDNLSFPGQGDGWIKQFYQNLNLMLAKRFGRLDKVKIWWDSKKLDGSVLFDDSIADGIKKSAIMICLNSPGYVASEYCKKELDLFYNKVKKDGTGLKVGDRSRILNVLLNNMPFKDWPEELSGTSGFPFHDSEESDDLGDTVETLSDQFREEMKNVRDAVCNILEDFQELKTPAITPKSGGGTTKPEGAETGFSIFMAEVADTQRSPRKRIIAELEKNDFHISQGIPPPGEKEGHDREAKAAIDAANLSVHLLDIYPGREISDSQEMSFSQRQAELGLASETPQIIWIPEDADLSEIEEESYRQFIEDLEEGNISDKEYEFIRGSKSTLAKQIMEFARRIQSSTVTENESDEEIPILLDAHEKDHLYALDLGKTLLQNNIRPFINPQEDDPRKNLDMLGNRMKQVRKLVFLYGNVSKEWVIERMNAALQLILTNNYPIEDFFIYMAPPHKEASDISINQRLLKVNVINSSQDQLINEEVVDKFLHDLKLES